MIDKLNTLGLPEKYDYLISKETQLVGLEYMGKKSETVIETVCNELTAFRSIGKICIIYKKPEDFTYTLSNKKKTEVLTGIYDFVAGPTFLYVQMVGQFKKDELEWFSLGKEFKPVKNMGVFKLHDVATNSGARVISSTRNSLDILDRHDKTCRIMLKDASIDEVITFGKKSETLEERPDSTEYEFEFNMSTGRVKMTGNEGNEIRVNSFKNIKVSKSCIVNIFDSEITEGTVTKKVKRHIENYDVVYVKNITAEKAFKVSSLLSRFEENSDFGIVSLLILTYTVNGLAYKIKTGFKDISKIANTNIIRGERQYALMLVNAEIGLIALILDRTSGKIVYDICNKENTNIWNIESNDIKISSVLCDIESKTDGFDSSELKLPLTIIKGKDAYGNSVENCKFDNILFIRINAIFKDKDGNDIENNLGIVLFDGLNYSIKKIKTRKSIEGLSKTEVHNKKYNADDIVLSTRTELFTVVCMLETKDRQ